jgi:hypothetical protein
VTAQNVSHRLIGQAVTQIGQGSDDAVISPAGVLSHHSHHQGFHFLSNPGRPGYCRCLEPSNSLATSLRYQAKMVSGLATQATARSALRPRRFPISARVARSGSLNGNLEGSFALRIRFLRPDIHSAAEAPGSPSPSRKPAAAPTSCSSCRLPILLSGERFSILTMRAGLLRCCG